MEAGIQQAIDALGRGEIVAIPTDTVYGVAASLDHPGAIDQVYAAKGRDAGKALPVLVDGLDRISEYATGDVTIARRLARAFWPGALTIVVPASDRVPWGIHRGAGTVGLRMPDDRIALSVIAACGGALAVTSANLSGRSEARSAGEVQATLGDHLSVIVDGGEATGGVPSTVVDLTRDGMRILRQGAIALEDLERALANE